MNKIDWLTLAKDRLSHKDVTRDDIDMVIKYINEVIWLLENEP